MVRNILIKKDNITKEFVSVKETAKFIGCSSSHICNILKNRVKNNTGWVIIKKDKVLKEKMKNIRIGLDLDGVIADFGGHFLNYIGIEDKTPAKEWNDARFMSNFHKIKQDEKFWTSIPPLIDPTEIDFNLVCYCTARSIPQEWTQLWLDAHGFPKVELISVGFDGNKVPHLKNKVDLFIDDAIHNFEELNKAGVNCILMTRSHNLGYDAGDKRINNLNEIIEYDYLSK